LIREADEHVVLQREHWAEHFTPAAREADEPGTDGRPEPADKAAESVSPAEAQTAGRAFAVEWAKSKSPEDLRDLMQVAPRIPPEIDIALILEAEKSLGSLRERQELKHELRAGFWAAIKAAKETAQAA
jgi:hypothetical protein